MPPTARFASEALPIDVCPSAGGVLRVVEALS
jgi:hypothetical protein